MAALIELEEETRKRGREDDEEVREGKRQRGEGILEELHTFAPIDHFVTPAEYAEAMREWTRLPPPPLDPAVDAFAFMQFELDTSQEDTVYPEYGGACAGPVTVIRLFGATREGNSVMVHVHGFHPYLYVEAPAGFTPAKCSAFRQALELLVQDRTARYAEAENYVLAVEVVERESIYKYRRNGKRNFLRITVTLQQHLNAARKILEEGLVVDNVFRKFTTYESNINYELRFMIDTDIVGCSWIQLPAGSYSLRTRETQPRAVSHAQIEVDVAWDSFVAHAPEGEWLDLSPTRILSFDIECAGRRGSFPEAYQDPVIQIAGMMTMFGGETMAKVVWTLNTCAPIQGATVFAFRTEVELLRAFRDFITTVDPDVLTGYNINKFDLPYLLDRAKYLGIPDFHLLGRIVRERTTIKTTTFKSKAFGASDSKEIAIAGRVEFDMLRAIRRDAKLSMYSLNFVAGHYLDEQKEDMHYSNITPLQAGDSRSRQRVATYCLKDAILPQRLMDKLLTMVNYVEMARVTGVPLSWILTRGQQIKVASQLYRKANPLGYVIPAMEAGSSTEVQYAGATVLDPKRGFYNIPITTLDFSSLYPSIMMAHNLCYSTLLSPTEAAFLPDEEKTVTPTGDVFAKATTRKGILPEILDQLLKARKRAKKAMEGETDPFRKAVLNGRQLALKISANSVYGFTGATVGKLPCLEISASVTAFGRQMIDQTQKLVEARYTVANGYDFDAFVVYGDTDSVMIHFGLPDVGRCLELGREAAAYVTSHFIPPISLEMEKAYFPYLLINKKRYAGLYWTKPNKPDKLDTKGLETVRRDNCRMLRMVLETSINKLLRDRDVEGAIAHVKETISRLLRGEVDLFDLIISKQYSKSEDDYSNVQAHIELVKKIRARDPGSAPVMGDRIAYIVIKGPPKAKAYEKAEDPMYVLENNIPIDTKYYLEKQLKKPLERIFEPIVGSTAELFHGEHTRKIRVATSSVGGIMAFTVKARQCLGCKGALRGEDVIPVCRFCKPRISEIYLREIEQTRKAESEYRRMWTQCQSCMGTFHQEIMCSNDQCPIFFARTKAKIELEKAEERVAPFSLEW